MIYLILTGIQLGLAIIAIVLVWEIRKEQGKRQRILHNALDRLSYLANFTVGTMRDATQEASDFADRLVEEKENGRDRERD